MTKSFKDIMAQEGMPRTNSSSDKPSRDSNKQSTVRKDIPRGPAGADKHGKKQSTEESLEISREKATTIALKALQLIS